MNLVYTCTSYPPAVGGAQSHMHHLARELSTRHNVQVATHLNRHRTDWLLAVTLRAPTRATAYQQDGIPVQRLAISLSQKAALLPAVLGYYLAKGLAIQRIADVLEPQLARLVREADVIHNGRIGREPLSLASLNLARKLDIPFVFTPFHHPRWVGWNYRHYLDLYRRADAVVALTPVEADTLKDLGVAPERIFVTGTGPELAPTSDAARFRRRLAPPEAPLILFLGQKYRYKGWLALLQAAPLVWERHPSANFAFLGPPTRSSRRLNRLSDPRLLNLDWVDLQTKTDALAACDLLCVPSSQESFGSVLVEAWMLGKPVVAGPAPAVRAVVDAGEDGFLVPQQPAAIAERIVTLLDDPALCREMGHRGQAKAEADFTWPVLAQKTDAVYTQLL
jgi:glycosyltransferase involved in cell wall biosynthesis